MLTKLIFKLSLFAATITFVYCIVNNIAVSESLSRAVIVFAGFYVILIAFFITLRLIFKPGKEDEDTEKLVAEATEVAEDRSESEQESQTKQATGVEVE